MLGKSEDNCRQILSRARRRVADERPRFDPDPGERRALAARFLAAARKGDMEGLVAMLAPDAVLVGDGGGKARSLPAAAARRRARSPAPSWPSGGWPRSGASRSSRRSSTASRASAPSRPDGRLVNVVSIDVEDGVVQRIYSMLNPDKLGHLGPLSTRAARRRCGQPHRHDACHPHVRGGLRRRHIAPMLNTPHTTPAA